jgi:RNA recognition motif-containing protein
LHYHEGPRDASQPRAVHQEIDMQVLIRGLHRDITEQQLRDKISPYAPVRSVELVRDGDPERPWAWVNLDVDPFTAWRLLRQFDRQYFAGGMMRWYIPAHQSND